jgi:hypothetical protein
MADHFAVMAGRLLTPSTVQSAIDEASDAPPSTVAAASACGEEAVPVGRPKSGVLVECRICQDEDDETCMEAPCSCKGSLKVKNLCVMLPILLCFYHYLLCILFLRPVPQIESMYLTFFQYAHRTCVQRWCDEKGDTICEICLQVKFGFFCQLLLMSNGYLKSII